MATPRTYQAEVEQAIANAVAAGPHPTDKLGRWSGSAPIPGGGTIYVASSEGDEYGVYWSAEGVGSSYLGPWYV